MRNIILAVLSACIVLAACNTQQRQIYKLDALAIGQPNEFARLSNLLNPCFTGKAKSDTVSKTDTLLFKGDTTVGYSVLGFHTAPYYTHDSIWVKSTGKWTKYIDGAIINRDTVIKTITIRTPGRLIINTITIHDTIADNRALMVVKNNYTVKRDSLIIAKTNAVRTSKNLSIWRMIALCACGLILIFIVVKVYVFFSGGAAASIIKKVT